MVPERPSTRAARGYGGAALALAAATALAALFDALGLDPATLVLAYIPSVAATGARFGRGPAVASACGAVLLYNFFFTAPRFTLRVDDAGHIVTFVVMLGIGIFVSSLTAALGRRTAEADERRLRAEETYRISRSLSATTGSESIVAVAERELSRSLNAEVRVVLEAGTERASSAPKSQRTPALTLPFCASTDVRGAVVVHGAPLTDEQRQAFETHVALVALALEREDFGRRAREAHVAAEGARLRASLSSSMSHDLRTPLAAITVAGTSLVESWDTLAPAARNELLASICDEADRLTRIVDDLLHLTRLASGHPVLRKEWHVVEDLIGSALHRVSRSLGARHVELDVPASLPLVSVDGVLIELALINLIDNAAKHTPPGTDIALYARTTAGSVELDVCDRGPGVPEHDRARVFEPFQRGVATAARGTGLGLTICRAIAEVHGGTLTVEERDGGGATFRLALPLEEQPPDIDTHPDEEPADEREPGA